jgi:hypothetical protein
LSVTITPTDDGALLQDNGTAAILADQKIVSDVTNGTGGGNMNIEKIGVNLINSSGEFVSMIADDYVDDQNDGFNYFYPVGGELQPGTATEADVEYTVPFAMTVSRLVMRVVTEQMTADSFLHLRKNGADTGLFITVPGTGGAGYWSQAGAVSFAAGDRICYRLDTTGAGTRLRNSYFAIVASEDGGAPPGEELSGTATGASSVLAGLATAALLAGSLAGGSAVTASLEAAAAALSGTLTGSAILTGSLETGADELTGIANGTSAVTGDLTDFPAVPGEVLEGTLAGTSTLSGAIVVGDGLQGGLGGASTVTGDLTDFPVAQLAGDLAGASGFTGALSTAAGLSGTLDGESFAWAPWT